MRIAVVDRGQGIASSLKNVIHDLKNEADYLSVAFEQIISGRSPEQRGNGLKFVKKNFIKENGYELICISSGSKYKLGTENQLETALKSVFNLSGTLIAIDWKKDII